MREVAIIGVGMSVFGKLPEQDVVYLGYQAGRSAIKDAGISPKDIPCLYCANLYHNMVLGERIASRLGIANIEVINVENACAGGSTAVRGAWLSVASGMYDVAMAIGVESMSTSPIAGKLIPPAKDDLEGLMGFTMPAYFALSARRHMENYGTTPRQFVQASVKNHYHGSLNPYCQYRKELGEEEILNSRMICEPITLLQCCPNTDGAAAAILCSADIAKRYTSQPVFVAATVLKMGDYQYRRQDFAFSDLTYKTAQEAYEIAGYGPKDLDLVELHDAFAPAEICHYEELGLCAKGEGARLIDEKVTWLGGKIPVNPSGGLLSQGHPLSATGVRQLVEVTWHLRGQAGKRQVPNAKVGLAHTVGGAATGIEAGACTVCILKR
jgi:benzoylsuccinyl-CoA thiolase BbsB subunit